MKETMEMIDAIEAVIVAGENSVKDGAINAADLANVWPILPAMFTAIVGINKIPAEVKDPAVLQAVVARTIPLLGRAAVVVAAVIAILKGK